MKVKIFEVVKTNICDDNDMCPFTTIIDTKYKWVLITETVLKFNYNVGDKLIINDKTYIIKEIIGVDIDSNENVIFIVNKCNDILSLYGIK